jgi:hypothetical protein
VKFNFVEWIGILLATATMIAFGMFMLQVIREEHAEHRPPTCQEQADQFNAQAREGAKAYCR